MEPQRWNRQCGFEWIEVLHVANGDTVISAITDNLVLNLLPALHALLDQYLRTSCECFGTKSAQLILVLSKSRSKTTKCVRSTNDDGETNGFRSSNRVIRVSRCTALGALLANLLHGGSKQLPVLRGDNCLYGSAQNLNTELSKLVLQLNTDVQSCLATECYVDSIRFLEFDDFSNKLRSDGQEVDFVRQAFRCRDGGDVRVDHDSVNSLLLERLYGLRTGVVEFTCLTDGQAA